MINFIQSAECYVNDRSEIKFIIHFKFKIYFYISRFAIYPLIGKKYSRKFGCILK